MYLKTSSPKIILLILSFCFLLIPVIVSAKDVTLAWDRNTEPKLAGYRLYVREGGEHFNTWFPEWQGTATTCTISGLDEYESYYFVVRAFDTEGNESGNSNQVYLPATDDGRYLDTGSGGGGGSGGGCFISSVF